MQAVYQSALSLYYASEALKNDREIALSACSRNGLALKHVSDDLRADLSLVAVAVAQNKAAVEFAKCLS